MEKIRRDENKRKKKSRGKKKNRRRIKRGDSKDRAEVI